jgi:nucleoside-diphosphate-sugar epimerase
LKVLLTGANGFVGSHILDSLLSRAISTTLLLRPGSDRQFISPHVSTLEVRTGSILEPETLSPALAGITHVIHCAGSTKAVRPAGFYQVNHIGTRNLLEAVNRQPLVERFVQISSLAVSGPATPANPARETDPPRPISVYGQSKLAGEQEVKTRCRVAATIIRPPAVYGPRDHGFLPLFRAVKRHVLPRPSSKQALSLVFARDLAEAVVACLGHPAAAGQTYFVASPEIVTTREMAQVIAAHANHWALPCPLPAWALWPLCLGQELIARATAKPRLLNLQKFTELRAPGWVCDASLLKREIGFECPTLLKQGVVETWKWYLDQGWL